MTIARTQLSDAFCILYYVFSFSFHLPISVNGIFISLPLPSLLRSTSNKSADTIDSFIVLLADIPSVFSQPPLKVIQGLILNQMYRYFAKAVFVFVLWFFWLKLLRLCGWPLIMPLVCVLIRDLCTKSLTSESGIFPPRFRHCPHFHIQDKVVVILCLF